MDVFLVLNLFSPQKSCGARYTCNENLPTLYRVLWIYGNGNGIELCSLMKMELLSFSIGALVDSLM